MCGSFWRVDQIQNREHCHGNQDAKIVKFIPNFKKLYSNVSSHMQICNIINFQVCYHYHGNRGTKIMGWGDVRYCFARAILVTSSRLLSGDELIFYVSFSLFLLLFFHPFWYLGFHGNAILKMSNPKCTSTHPPTI